jgi:hypothetical protein
MASCEALARLTASAINPAACGGRSTSTERLSSSEIAFLLKGLTQEQMDFAQAKYCGDVSAQVRLLMNVRKYADDQAARGKWKVRPSQIQALAEQAVIESLTKRIASKQIASALGISEPAFCANWKDKFKLLLKPLYEHDGAVSNAVYRNSCNH